MRTKLRLPMSLWLVPALVPMLMGQTTCSAPTTDRRPIVKMSKSAKLIFPETDGGYTLSPSHVLGNTITDICVGHDKLVCEWAIDPGAARALEQYGPTTNYRPLIEEGDGVVENTVRCGSAETYAGICEDWSTVINGGPPMYPESVTLMDRGVCSASLPTDLFVESILNEFKKQADNRLGEIRDPEGRDVILWTDFVLGLKKGDGPFRAWTDWRVGTPFDGSLDGHVTNGEVIVEGNYRVDGNIEWNFDPDRYGDTTAGAALAISLQTIYYTNPLLFWTVFLGDCEKDRPMRVRFRGEFQATAEGGVGVKVNSSQTCGPNGDGPCTWAYVYPWPARPICNNRTKPEIEDNFVSGMIAGMVDPATNKPRCLTCTEDGGSLLPFKLENGKPLPVVRVVTGPKEITFVFIDDLTDPDQAEANARYDELYDRGLCNLARPVANVGLTDLTAGGMTR